MKAIVRKEIEKIEGVTRTWIEWTYVDAVTMAKTLVVEVDFDTDPNSEKHNQHALEEVGRIAKDALTNKTTMVISSLRVVPKDRR